ncbi:MAG: beta-galactosidase, partial [Terracidiphilus sp.]
MKAFSRREMLKGSLLAPAVAAAASGMNPVAAAMHAATETAGLLPAAPSGAAQKPAQPNTARERLLLDFGWRFHLGDACDATKDFGFGSGRGGNFQKTGGFLAASSLAFDDSDWKALDLPHDWAIELPFTNDPALLSKGFYPLGRNYPSTSIGWY